MTPSLALLALALPALAGTQTGEVPIIPTQAPALAAAGTAPLSLREAHWALHGDVSLAPSRLPAAAAPAARAETRGATLGQAAALVPVLSGPQRDHDAPWTLDSFYSGSLRALPADVRADADEALAAHGLPLPLTRNANGTPTEGRLQALPGAVEGLRTINEGIRYDHHFGLTLLLQTLRTWPWLPELRSFMDDLGLRRQLDAFIYSPDHYEHDGKPKSLVGALHRVLESILPAKAVNERQRSEALLRAEETRGLQAEARANSQRAVAELAPALGGKGKLFVLKSWAGLATTVEVRWEDFAAIRSAAGGGGKAYEDLLTASLEARFSDPKAKPDLKRFLERAAADLEAHYDEHTNATAAALVRVAEDRGLDELRDRLSFLATSTSRFVF